LICKDRECIEGSFFAIASLICPFLFQYIAYIFRERLCRYTRNAQKAIAKDINDDALFEQKFQPIFDLFKATLQEHQYYSEFLCIANLDNGIYYCPGKYNAIECLQKHMVNFRDGQTGREKLPSYQCDHVIEQWKIHIALRDAVLGKAPQGKEVALEYFYDLLLTSYLRRPSLVTELKVLN
jgi:hypothetical protein